MSWLEGAHTYPNPPPPLAFLVQRVVSDLFDFVEKVVGPGLQGLYVATPVVV